MLIEEIRSIKSEKKDLRKFGITVGIAFGFFGVIFLWRQISGYPYFFIASGLLISTGFIVPLFLKPIQKAWMTLAILLGWFMSRVILTILFFIIVTPTGLLARLIGKDFLNRRFKQNSDQSYWIKKKIILPEKSTYENQF